MVPAVPAAPARCPPCCTATARAPKHIALPAREFAAAIRHGGVNQVFNIAMADGTQTLALPKAIQRDPIKDTFEHVDLLIVRRGEKVTVDVPVQLVGEAAAGTLVDQRARHAVDHRRGAAPAGPPRGLDRGPGGRLARHRRRRQAARGRRAGRRPGARSSPSVSVAPTRRAARGRGRRGPRPRRPRPRPPRPARPSRRPASRRGRRLIFATRPGAHAYGVGRARSPSTTDRAGGAQVWLVVGLGNPGREYAAQPAQRRVPGRRPARRADRRASSRRHRRAVAEVAEGRLGVGWTRRSWCWPSR